MCSTPLIYSSKMALLTILLKRRTSQKHDWSVLLRILRTPASNIHSLSRAAQCHQVALLVNVERAGDVNGI
jgi:hypothetical protein